MWCEKCKHETNNEICELCGDRTEPVVPTEIYWCKHCNIPVIKYKNDPAKEQCPLCGESTKYMVADLRPVFPEERLLLEIILDKPLAYIDSSVWASNNRYYIDGKSIMITSKHYKKYSADYIREKLNEYTDKNSYDSFDKYISLFVAANKNRLESVNINIYKSA